MTATGQRDRWLWQGEWQWGEAVGRVVDLAGKVRKVVDAIRGTDDDAVAFCQIILRPIPLAGSDRTSGAGWAWYQTPPPPGSVAARKGQVAHIFCPTPLPVPVLDVGIRLVNECGALS